MAANPLLFQEADVARNAITASQQKEIAKLYTEWAKQINKKAQKYALKTNPSSVVSTVQQMELEAMLQEASKQMAQDIGNVAVKNMYRSANVVVQCNNEWMRSLGFNADAVNAAFSNVPMGVVQNIITGNVYQGGWNLSKAIWGIQESTMKSIHEIVAAGVAENLSTYEIAKKLEQFVNPSKQKPWNLKAPDGKMIYKKKVDYNAQRLVRTLVQHSYQQAFVTVTKHNPFITDYIWNANGSRVCELCKARDGKHFKKDELPLDHPNGMCVMVPNVDSYDDIADRLADWVKGKDDPAIDEYASKLGFDIPKVEQQRFTPEQQKYLGPYGYSPGHMPANFDEWSHKISWEQGTEILNAMGTGWSDDHPYQQLQKYYEQVLMGKGTIPQVVKKQVVPGAMTGGMMSGADFAAKYGTSSGKTFNYWYSKLSPEAKEIAKQLKGDSGMSWQEWYEANIYKAKAGAKPKVPAPKPTATKAQKAQNATVPSQLTEEMKRQWQKIFASQDTDAMLEFESKYLANLPREQLDAITTYTGSSFSEMNGYLRRRYRGVSEEDAARQSGLSATNRKKIDKISEGLSQLRTQQDMVLYRGTGMGELAGFIAGAGDDFNAVRRQLGNMPFEQLRSTFVGTVKEYAGFTSTCCTNSRYQWDNSGFRGGSGSVEMAIFAPKGTPASPIMSISQFDTAEGEFLLDKGTRIYIHDIEQNGRVLRVWAEIVPNT